MVPNHYPAHMKIADILCVLRALAPEHLAEPWDKVGLQVGDAHWPLTPRAGGKRGNARPRAMLCIDLTEPVMAEAVEAGVALIVAYHPPIFDPLPRLTGDDWKGRIVMRAIEQRIAIYSPHTALDSAAGGVNDWLCETVLPGVMAAVSADAEKGATAKGGTIRPIRPSSPGKKERPYKLVTFVPPKHLEPLREALFHAGAGSIGAYDQCSFSLEGEGTFRGGEGTNPTIGVPGKLERVNERRLETIVPAGRLAEVVAALMKAHPYEEPAFDLIRLDLPPSSGGEGVGQGRVVTLEKPIALATLIARLKNHLGVERLDVAAPPGLRRIRTIGVCAGAGGSLLEEAGPVDAFITGELRHHQVLAGVSRGQAIVLAGHTQTERPYLPVYRERLRRRLGTGVEWLISRQDRPPARGA